MINRSKAQYSILLLSAIEVQSDEKQVEKRILGTWFKKRKRSPFAISYSWIQEKLVFRDQRIWTADQDNQIITQCVKYVLPSHSAQNNLNPGICPLK